MRVTAKADYAVRAAAMLAAAGPGPVKGEHIAATEHIPLRFLHNILSSLTRAGVLTSLRGAEGGYELTRPPSLVTVADVVRGVEGPFWAGGQARRSDTSGLPEAPSALQSVWAAVRASERAVLESVTLADLAGGCLPERVRSLLMESQGAPGR
jgi:Rrf2 family protein